MVPTRPVPVFVLGVIALLLPFPNIGSAARPKKQTKSHTALFDAMLKGDMAAFNALLARGVDPNSTNEDGIYALEGAAMLDSAEMVKALLAKGADPNGKDKDGETALMAAAS